MAIAASLATNEILLSEQAGKALALSVGDTLTVSGETMTSQGCSPPLET